MKKFYLTTAIDYVNGQPHLGHTYEKVLADTIARYHRLKNEDVHFLTGVDEHGQKVQQKAQSEGVEPQLFCDQMAQKFVDLTHVLNLSNDDFVRTTQERHKRVVRLALQKLYDQGLIYKAEYRGFYSVKEERFLQDKDRIHGEWPTLFGEVKEIVENNYFFKLSAYQDWLIAFLNENTDFVLPQFRQKQVLEFLKEPLNDLCISRPQERLQWGIPLPFDAQFITYVWFDALLNYVSAVGYGQKEFANYWPADLHVIGKDILVPAHAVYWPIMLKALDIPLPKHLLVHGWWLTSGEKLSKSLGNAFDLFEWLQSYGTDAARYFLLREMVTGQDCEFSIENFIGRYNHELANEWGNLVSRTFNMLQRYCQSRVPVVHSDSIASENLQMHWGETHKSVFESFDNFLFSQGLEKLFKFIRELNRFVENQAPWKLSKTGNSKDQYILENTLAFLVEGIRLCAQILQVIIPESSAKILKALQVSRTTDFTWNTSLLQGALIADPLLLFPKK
ncbi:MAG: methionine--tRNA ligase [Puniceicoccales bacterium]|jgi:methionyl-tRNA synthetase|nr:methionine--tRNA ligase [Puniceicoccales bacterium]